MLDCDSAVPTYVDILDAADRLAGVAEVTPLLHSAALDEVTGGRVFVKAEVLQTTGSFKFRGAYNRLSRLTPDQRRAGVVAFSSGNHGQGVAAAAALVGCPALIVMPADAPAVKIEATRALGAEIVFHDRFTQPREAIAATLATERGAVLVPSYDDPHVVAGQGTVGLETARRLEAAGERADLLLCPASGGGLMAGIALAFQALSPATALYAVEPRGFEDHALSLAAGERVAGPPGARSLCDALLAPLPGRLTFPINRSRLAGALAVSDDEALAAMAFGFHKLRLVLEPGGAVALAALLSGRVDLRGRTAVVVASGGNVDPALFARAITDAAG